MRTLSLLPLALAACATTPPPEAAAPAERYRATGTEPFWSVTIENGRMRLEEPNGEPIDVAAPVARPSFNGRRYVTPGLTVDVIHGECSDGMSDRVYPDTVTVTAGDRTLKGCGRPVGDAADLAGTSWRISAIDMAPPAADARPATVSFTADRLSGSTGCNRFFGSYRIEGDRLIASGVGATRMACPGPVMAQEARILALLAQPLELVPGKDGYMLQAGEGGSITLAR